MDQYSCRVGSRFEPTPKGESIKMTSPCSCGHDLSSHMADGDKICIVTLCKCWHFENGENKK
jgi:hypothetical protein